MMLTNHRPGKPFAECGVGRGMREWGTEGDGGEDGGGWVVVVVGRGGVEEAGRLTQGYKKIKTNG